MVPCLITVAVAQFQMLGRAVVSAPQLHASRKKRSSRRYLPSSSEPPSDDATKTDQLSVGGDNDMDIDPEERHDNDLAARGTIDRAQQGIWSGRRHGVVESEGEESDGNNDDEEDNTAEGSEDKDYNYWEEYDDLEDPSGLSALDRLGEDFERNAVANSGSLSTKTVAQPNF